MRGRQHWLPALEAASDCGHTRYRSGSPADSPGCMQGIPLRVWRHRRYRTTPPLDSRADTVDSSWCPSSMPARVPAPSAQALEHGDGRRQDHLACHNRPCACLGTLGVPCPVAYLTRRRDETPCVVEEEGYAWHTQRLAATVRMAYTMLIRYGHPPASPVTGARAPGRRRTPAAFPR